MIKEPKLDVYDSRANPLLIVGVLIAVSPFIFGAIGMPMGDIASFFLMGIGILMSILGGVMYLAETF